MTRYVDLFCLLLDAWRVATLHRDTDRLESIDARYSEGHGTTLAAWKKRCVVLDRNGAFFQGSSKLQLDMPYVPCPEEREKVACLSTLIVSLKVISGLSDQDEFYTGLHGPHDTSRFLKVLVTGEAIATSNVKYKQCVVSRLRAGVVSTCVKASLDVVGVMRQLRANGLAISAVASGMFRRLPCWRISFSYRRRDGPSGRRVVDI